MKKLQKSRRFRTFLLVYILFCTMFPYSLIAENQTYKVPKNSINYFIENSRSAKVTIIEPPDLKQTSNKLQKPSYNDIVKQSSSLKKQNNSDLIGSQKEDFSMSWKTNMNHKKETHSSSIYHKKALKKSIVHSQKKAVPTSVVNQIKTQKQKIIEPKTEKIDTTSFSSPFAQTLARMQSKRAQRAAEAKKLGIILPSQGGDMHTVSPALSKLNQAIKNILSRN